MAAEAPASSLPADLQLVVFDLAGTTLDDLVDGIPIAISAIRSAFARVDIDVDIETLTAHRGLEKSQAIRKICLKFQEEGAGLEELAEKVHGYFKESLAEVLCKGPLKEIAGTSDTFKALQARGVKIVIGSGFAKEIVDQVVGRLGWKVEGWCSAPRPKPDGIIEAMSIAKVEDKGRVLKVGDTVADIEEGKNAGVWTAAVMTGTQKEADLRAASPDFLFPSVADLPSLLPPA